MFRYHLVDQAVPAMLCSLSIQVGQPATLQVLVSVSPAGAS
jgi:hypothetical protein